MCFNCYKRVREYRKHHKVEITILELYEKAYRRKRIMHRRLIDRRNDRRARRGLKNSYIKHLLSDGGLLKSGIELSGEILDLKRAELKFLRFKKIAERRIQNGTIRKKHNGTEAIDSTTEKR